MAILINVNIQFVDESGNPYAAGLYYFGQPNEDPVLLPKTVFADPGLTAALPNPQVLNARGAFQQAIYRPSTNYSHQLNDVLENQIFLVSDDDGSTTEASDRIFDNPENTTINDQNGVAGLILSGTAGTPAVTQVLHNGQEFIQGDDEDTILFDTTGVEVFKATINAPSGPLIITTIGCLDNETAISIDETDILIQHADSSVPGLHVTASMTNLGSVTYDNAVQVTNTLCQITSRNGGVALRVADDQTQLGARLNDAAVIINTTSIVLSSPAGSNSLALVITDGVTTLRAATNETAVRITGNSTIISSPAETEGLIIEDNSTNLSAAANVDAIAITATSTSINALDCVNINAVNDINMNADIVFPSTRTLTATTGNVSLVSAVGDVTIASLADPGDVILSSADNVNIIATGRVDISGDDVIVAAATASTDVTINAGFTSGAVNLNGRKTKITSTENVNTNFMMEITKGTNDLQDEDNFIQFFRGSADPCGFIQINSINVPTFMATSDRRLKSNYAPVENILAKVRNVPVYFGDKIVSYLTGETVPCMYRIADEVAAEFPNLVSGKANAVDKKGKPVYQHLSTDATDILWASMIEAANLIEDLEARLTAIGA